jgi:hypothetical protein
LCAGHEQAGREQSEASFHAGGTRNSGLYTSRLRNGGGRIVTDRTGQWGLVLLALASLFPVAHAGSYMRSGGDLSYSTSFGYYWATERWDAQGNLQASGCRREYLQNSHYLEYGHSYYYTLFGGVGLAQASCAEDTHAGLGDVRAGVRGRTNLYRNHSTWELVATLPTDRGSPSPRLGCGAFGLAAALARKDNLMPGLAFGSGIGLQLWESPLAHQVDADVSLSGPLQFFGRLRWGFEVSGRAPLEGGTQAIDTDISDCGTGGKVVKTGLRIGASLSKRVHVDCGFSRAVWGDDATLSQGFTCGYSHLWE